MNLSKPFVRRPIATVLLTIGLALAGIGAFFVLPVSPLPQVDFPAISVSASLPGASPDTMATSVATPLERRLAVIAGVNEMTSNSGNGSTRINLQFDLNRQIDSAAREVQAAISASRADLPSTLRSNPTYRKANPSDAPVIILALTSKRAAPARSTTRSRTWCSRSWRRCAGVGDVEIGGGSLPAVRVDLNPYPDEPLRRVERGRARGDPGQQREPPERRARGQGMRLQIYSQANTPTNGRTAPTTAAWSWPGATAPRSACRTSRTWTDASRTSTRSACSTASRR
jgi:multidrug efflux pump